VVGKLLLLAYLSMIVNIGKGCSLVVLSVCSEGQRE
jgi:hypothetical protein